MCCNDKNCSALDLYSLFLGLAPKSNIILILKIPLSNAFKWRLKSKQTKKLLFLGN